MKARSFVFTHLQWPATIFGLPPKLMVAALALAFFVYMACILLRLALIMVPATIISGAAGLAGAYVLGKRDPHVETVFLPSLRFWRSSPCRRLLAGAPSSRSRGGRP